MSLSVLGSAMRSPLAELFLNRGDHNKVFQFIPREDEGSLVAASRLPMVGDRLSVAGCPLPVARYQAGAKAAATNRRRSGVRSRLSSRAAGVPPSGTQDGRGIPC